MVTCEVEESDIEVSVSVLALVHTDISLLWNGKPDIVVSVSVLTRLHKDNR